MKAFKKQKHLLKKAVALFSLCFFCLQTGLEAQILDSQNKIDVILDDGTQVIMYGKSRTRNNAFTSEFYYLPTNLHLSKRPDGTPEFLFLMYTTDERADAGGAQGALMHFLMEWGLSPEQEDEAQIKLREKINMLNQNPGSLYKKVRNPVIAGAADVSPADGESFRIISAILTDAGVAKVVASGKATSLPGTKIAVAAKLDNHAAQLLAATLEESRSITDVSIELSFKYDALFPAVDGKIVINWSKVESLIDSISATYTRDRRETKSGNDDIYTYDEVEKIYNTAIESKAVTFDIDKNTTSDETANKIVEEFMNVFTEALADRDTRSRPSPPSKKEKEISPDIKHGSQYTYNKVKAEKRYQRKIEIYNLKYRTAVSKFFSLTENLGSWYDGVRDNPKCVATINISDRFYKHRDINLILDLEAEEMFGKEVNHVTVNVRKKRDGTPFEDYVTIDRTYLKEKGIKASLTYARNGDNNQDVYEYKMQWSLRGGKVYPKNPKWIVGEWEGVTLAAPVKPRLIELEGDLDELKANGITRVTAAIRYYKFGKEVETNIPLKISKGEPLVSETIFTDRDSQGYAYRLIFSHKDEGKLALEWDAKINDDYVYATIPEAFRDKESPVFKEIKKRGNEVLETAADKVLDKFKNLINGNNEN